MLRPQDVENYAQRAAAAFDDLELNILTDMARRIAKADYMTEGAKWQAERAKALGATRQHLAERMNSLMENAAPTVAVIFAQAMLDAEEQDNRFYRAAGQQEPEGIGTSTVAQQIAQSGYRRTMNTLYNLTQTRALMGNHNLPVAVQEQLGRILDQGHMGVATGAFSLDAVVRRGIKELAAEGVDAITYPSGHTDKLETVVLRAMRTGINQTAMDIGQNNARSMGVDIMELSAHGGARTGDGGPDFTNHSWWQGKLVSLSGQPGYLTLEDIGYGDVRGFAGANCRHNWHPFWPGISKPAYTQEMLDDYNVPKFSYNGQMLTEEQADRKQRSLERQIRRWKREFVLAKETGQADLQSRAAARLAAARGGLDDFLQQTGRHKQQLRETVPGFGRSEASSAVWAARRTTNAGQLNDSGARRITKITEQSIGNLPVVKCASMNASEAQRIHSAAQELLRTARDKNGGNEVCFVFRQDWSEKRASYGNDRGASFSIMGLGRGLTVLHNHPRNGHFSPRDLTAFVANPEIQNFGRVCNNGTIQILRRVANSDQSKLLIWYSRFLKACSKIDKNNINAYNALLEKHIAKATREGLFECTQQTET